MSFLFLLKKKVRDLVQQWKRYGLSKLNGKNYSSAVKDAWGWELLSAKTAGAERVNKHTSYKHNTQQLELKGLTKVPRATACACHRSHSGGTDCVASRTDSQIFAGDYMPDVSL